jgi:hypothetical protein
MSKLVRIYGLYSTRNCDDIKYIGKTICRLSDRMDKHRTDSRNPNKNTHKDRWIRREVRDGYKVNIKLIATGPESNWQELEIFWIAEYKRLGYKLVNTELGGGIDGEKLNAKPVVVLARTGKYINEYKSIALASRELDLKDKYVRECLCKTDNAKSHKGYQFILKDEYNPLINYDLTNIKKIPVIKQKLSHDELSKIYKINSLKAREVNMKPIGRYDLEWNLIETYPSKGHACSSGEYNISGIDKIIAGKRHTHKGCNWKYI